MGVSMNVHGVEPYSPQASGSLVSSINEPKKQSLPFTDSIHDYALSFIQQLSENNYEGSFLTLQFTFNSTLRILNWAFQDKIYDFNGQLVGDEHVMRGFTSITESLTMIKDGISKKIAIAPEILGEHFKQLQESEKLCENYLVSTKWLSNTSSVRINKFINSILPTEPGTPLQLQILPSGEIEIIELKDR